ncbi:MAG: hypothetical protein AB1609_15080 [Bacillota bacterium]
MYAGSQYRPGVALLQVGGLVVLFVVPAVWALAGGVGALAGVAVAGWGQALAATLISLALGVSVAKGGAGLPGASGLLAPVGAALYAFAMVRAVWRAERQGGVWWRETFYPLALLRQQARR